ncbi:MAG: hypothetical protein MUD12_11435 [Spirochaetes bacterium]|nr:hypothetical protein [Spirochaetota bacterium]
MESKIVKNISAITTGPEKKKASLKTMTLRPYASQKGTMSLFVCGLTAFFTFALTLALFFITGQKEAKILLFMGVFSAVILSLGIVLYLVFPRVKIIFDPAREMALIKSGKKEDRAVPFHAIRPFMITEIVRGYAHQYMLSNPSFGEYTDLFCSTFRSRCEKKAKRILAVTGGTRAEPSGL